MRLAVCFIGLNNTEKRRGAKARTRGIVQVMMTILRMNRRVRLHLPTGEISITESAMAIVPSARRITDTATADGIMGTTTQRGASLAATRAAAEFDFAMQFISVPPPFVIYTNIPPQTY